MFFYFLLLAFRLTLDITYFLFVNPMFEYAGFTLDLSFNKYLLSWLIYVATLPFLKTKIILISDYFFMTYVLFIIAPLTSLYGLTNWKIEPLISTITSYYLFLLIVRSKWIKIPKIPPIKNGEKIAIRVSSAFVIFLFIWYFISGAQFNLNFNKVYEFREQNTELSSTGLLAYLSNWTYKIFSIFFISYYLLKKNWLLVILGIIAQIIFYGFSTHKSVLFSLFLVFGIWFWFKKSNKAYVFPLVLNFILILSLLLFIFTDYLIISSMLIRRVFYVPAYLTYQYFEFFSENHFIYWSNSFLSSIFDYPYDLSVPKTIGQYLGNNSSANNGYVSMGYAHFGYLGIFIYTILFALIIRFFDLATKKIGFLWLSLAISISPLRDALISSDLTTTLLTHGLAVIILLIVLCRKNPKYDK